MNCKNKFGNMGMMSLRDSMSYIFIHGSLTIFKYFRLDFVSVNDFCNIYNKYKNVCKRLDENISTDIRLYSCIVPYSNMSNVMKIAKPKKLILQTVGWR